RGRDCAEANDPSASACGPTVGDGCYWKKASSVRLSCTRRAAPFNTTGSKLQLSTNWRSMLDSALSDAPRMATAVTEPSSRMVKCAEILWAEGATPEAVGDRS